MSKKWLAAPRLITILGVVFVALGALVVSIQLTTPSLVGAADGDASQADIDLAVAATVRLSARTCSSQVTGSGFAVASLDRDDTVLLTNEHIVSGALEAKADQPIRPALTAVVAISHAVDLAELAPVGSVALEFSEREPEAGDFIAVIGHPGGSEAAVIKTQVRMVVDGDTWGQEGGVLLFDAELVAGFSGGPVVGSDGKVVAIVTGYSPATGLGVALLAEDVQMWLRSEASPQYKIVAQAESDCSD